MKRIVILITFAAMMCGMVNAQDTVWQKTAPLNHYYYNNWLDTTERNTMSWSIEIAHVIAKQFVTKDSLQIYGIAAMMLNQDTFSFSHYGSGYYSTFQDYLNATYPEDPGFENCEETLMLYQYHGTISTVMQQLGDSLRVHYIHTPVNHWLISNTVPMSYTDTIAKPIYERYFSVPQTVRDTFFVGYTQGDFEMVKEIDGEDTVTVSRRVRPGLQVPMFTSNPSMSTGYDEGEALLRPSTTGSSPTWVFRSTNQYFSLFIFPILTPPTNADSTVTPIDSTVVPVDSTLGVKNVDMVGRYVSVSPNPAGDRATVLSSFGLTSIEAYDPQGRKLYTLPATGLKVELDVSAWPRGTVLLHIHTPAGTTVKKLLLR